MKQIKLLSLCLAIAMLFSGCSTIGQPPAPQRIEETFQNYREEIQMVTDYLLTQNPPVAIDSSSRELPEDVVWAVRNLMRSAGWTSIHYRGNTIYFILWTRFTDAGCGIAYSVGNTLEADLPFLTQVQPLSERDWYYYVEDYAKWRTEKNP